MWPVHFTAQCCILWTISTAMPTTNRYLRLNAVPSSRNLKKNNLRCYLLHGLLLILSLGATGLNSCYSGRVPVPATGNEPALKVAAPVTKRVVTVHGRVFSARDSTVVIPGMELIFCQAFADSTETNSRTQTALDGAYRIDLNTGQSYKVILNKDGRKVEELQYAVPGILSDSSAFVRNLYTVYSDSCCIDYGNPVVYFDTNRSAPRPQFLARIDELIKSFPQQGLDSLAVVVEGHSEPSEVPPGHLNREQYILGIGWERAKATCDYLTKNGIPANKLFLISYGAQRPAAYNYSPEERQLNRRAEIRLTTLEYISLRNSGRYAPSIFGGRVVPYLKYLSPAKRPGSKPTLGSRNKKRFSAKL